MKTRLSALLAAVALAAAADRSTASFEMGAWRDVVPTGLAGPAVFSPAGFVMSTAVIGEGLGGSARSALMETFGLMSDFSHIGNVHLASHEAANASNRVSVAMATSLWTTRRKALSADYVHTIQRGFDAEAGYLRSVLPVNAWTEARTGGRISNVLPEIPKKLDTIVINAVAFEGAWKKPFDDSLTKKSGFARANGSKASVPMMRGEREMLRIARPRFTLYSLDFSAPWMHFLVVLPKQGVSLDMLRQKDMTGDSMDALKALLRERAGSGVKEDFAEFSMPAFEVRSEWRLEGALRKAKIPRKGFERIGSGPFVIDDVRQFVHFRVSEAGYSLTPGLMPDNPQKAGGQTGGELASATDDDDEENTSRKAGAPVVCDRPFLFFVWDSRADSFLIAGQFTVTD